MDKKKASVAPIAQAEGGEQQVEQQEDVNKNEAVHDRLYNLNK